MRRFIVIGLGNFGASVAEALHAAGHDVAAVDLDPDRVDQLARKVTRAAVGDATDASTLRKLGAEDAEGAVISTGGDITASALSALVMRDLGVDDLYVKVVSHEHARLIEKIGVTETIFPERESGIRLGKRISRRMLLNLVELGHGFSVQEMAVPERWVGRSLRDLELPKRQNIFVIAIYDVLLDKTQPVPDPDTVLKDSDTLVIAGLDENLRTVTKLT
jgi:trk system potassium uptake protein TrkA